MPIQSGRKRTWTDEQLEQALALRETHSFAEIAEKVGVNRPTVQYMFRVADETTPKEQTDQLERIIRGVNQSLMALVPHKTALRAAQTAMLESLSTEDIEKFEEVVST